MNIGVRLRRKVCLNQIDETEYQRCVASLPSLAVALGSMTIHIHSLADLGTGQLGYSVDPDGKSLVGEAKGDWREDWQVAK